MEHTFLPVNYKRPSKAEQFLKIPIGNTTIRILSKTLIEGFLVFDETNKPHRLQILRDENGNILKECYFTKEHLASINARKRDGGIFDVKYFWLVLVYHYESMSFKAFEITQKSIQDAIANITKIKVKEKYPYADVTAYDLVISREGETINTTKYSVNRLEIEPVDNYILDTLEQLKVNLEAVFTNEYPFD